MKHVKYIVRNRMHAKKLSVVVKNSNMHFAYISTEQNILVGTSGMQYLQILAFVLTELIW